MIVFGFILGIFKKDLGVIGDSIHIFAEIDYKVALTLFFPILIFVTNINQDLYLLKNEAINILICSGIGLFF